MEWGSEPERLGVERHHPLVGLCSLLSHLAYLCLRMYVADDIGDRQVTGYRVSGIEVDLTFVRERRLNQTPSIHNTRADKETMLLSNTLLF